MTTATQENVTKLYIAVFKRAPDKAGLNYWVNYSELNLEQIAQSFFDQPETQARYMNVSNQDFINTIYLNVLGREAEAEGLAYWLGELESGSIRHDQMILAIVNGAQGTDAQLLANRTEIGLFFAENSYGDPPNEFEVIAATDATHESVELVKDWIIGSNSFIWNPWLADDDVAYDLQGSNKDDFWFVEEFKSAQIDGRDGNDTLDFQDYNFPGITVDLTAGVGPQAMQILSIENIRATSDADTLIGNDDPNILVSMSGADSMVGRGGDDRFMFENVTDVANGSISGGEGADILEIIAETNIQVSDATFANVSGVEMLQIGYKEEGVPQAATLTLSTGVGLSQFQEIRGTDSHDRGIPTSDVIQTMGNLDLRGITLTSIEELHLLSDGAAIAIDAASLTGIQTISGVENGTGYLYVQVAEGETLDMGAVELNNISLWDTWLI